MAESRHPAATLATLARIVAGAGRGMGAIADRLRARGSRIGRLALAVQRIMAGSGLSGLVAPFISIPGGDRGEDGLPMLAMNPTIQSIASATAAPAWPRHAPMTAAMGGVPRGLSASVSVPPVPSPTPQRRVGRLVDVIHRITTRQVSPTLPAHIGSGAVGTGTVARHASLSGYVPAGGGEHIIAVPQPVTTLSVSPVSGTTGPVVPMPAITRPAAFLPTGVLAQQPAGRIIHLAMMRAAPVAGATGDRAPRIHAPFFPFSHAAGKALSSTWGGNEQSTTVTARGTVPMPIERKSTGVIATIVRPDGSLTAGLPAFRPDHAGGHTAGMLPFLSGNMERTSFGRMLPFHPMGGQAAWGNSVMPTDMVTAGTGWQGEWARPSFISPVPVVHPDTTGRGGKERGSPAPMVQVTIPLKLDHHVLGQAVARIDTNRALHEHRATGTAADVMQYPQMPGRSIGR